MDPLASVKEFRDKEGGQSRTLKVAPPPPIPVTPAAPVAPAVDDLNPTGELDLTDLQDSGGVEKRLPGNTRGRKQLLYVYLPGPTIQLLDDARPGHGTLGAAVMAALRGSYEWLVEHHTPPAGGSGRAVPGGAGPEAAPGDRGGPAQAVLRRP
jgi:hypothetical protein